jgi:RNA polymerase sigma-70 factor (ECF subfamily)
MHTLVKRVTRWREGIMLTDENATLEKAIRGSVDAFEELITLYEKRIYNIALRMMGNPSDAQDMAQEAIIKAYRPIGSFKGACRFSSWVYRITVNTCLDEIRKRKKRNVALIDMTDGESSGFVDGAPLPEAVVESREGYSGILAAVGGLNEIYRTVIVLRDMQGFSYQDISEMTNCSIGTVKSRINRARNILKSVLQRQGNNEVAEPSKR